MSGMIRILWMFGAAGLLLTATGILGRITLGSAAETLGKMWDCFVSEPVRHSRARN
jgi:hypothetical protein